MVNKAFCYEVSLFISEVFLALKSLSDNNLATQAWYIFLHPFTYYLSLVYIKVDFFLCCWIYRSDIG